MAASPATAMQKKDAVTSDLKPKETAIALGTDKEESRARKRLRVNFMGRAGEKTAFQWRS